MNVAAHNQQPVVSSSTHQRGGIVSSGESSMNSRAHPAVFLARRNNNMERLSENDLKAHLMESDDEFRRLATAHTEYARKIEAIEALPHPSVEQRLEEVKLKKLKLHAKDLMAAIMSRHTMQTQ
jgi:uncharacterized protein YdcH (DUF465 family)